MKDIERIKHYNPESLLLIAGPCVVESEELVYKVAEELKRVSELFKIPVVLKSSFRKANRSRLDSFTGIGDLEALKILDSAGSKFGLPVVTDIHTTQDADMVSPYVQMIQIPAFLCRQTELLVAAAKTGKWINIKKGQFLSGDSMRFAVDKVRSSGNSRIILTERGNMFGYRDLIVDMRNIPELKKNELPVIMDITHSLQQPNQPGGVAGGQPEMIETIGLAAIAAGAGGVFIETHPDPGSALSDGENMLPLKNLETLIRKFTILKKTINSLK